MKKMTHQDKLLHAILILEEKKAHDELIFKDQLKITYESLKPSVLIKSTLEEIISLPDFNENIVDTSMGLVSGYLSKKVAIGSSHNVFKQIIGSLIQLGVTNVVAKNGDQIRAFAKNKIANFLARNEDENS